VHSLILSPIPWFLHPLVYQMNTENLWVPLVKKADKTLYSKGSSGGNLQGTMSKVQSRSASDKTLQNRRVWWIGRLGGLPVPVLLRTDLKEGLPCFHHTCTEYSLCVRYCARHWGWVGVSWQHSHIVAASLNKLHEATRHSSLVACGRNTMHSYLILKQGTLFTICEI
jgi:hypothetical protein